ncbi:Redoxin [Pyronema domesticum]|uniref:Thioredoxin peroxidase n=1 Tax=Pyronema omphalodes (strain CBS 100304) TaxID=1076935 RepID=U4L763_PYROM|nr:Redoxin [Pyronema domesticum]CCX08477.1 Similar to Putative peroxiredoxin pmp20; acc. no. Q5ASN8 [Pyronema omphalodes CBS 100304]
MSIKAGDNFPEGVTFSYIPYMGDDITTCGRPIQLKASEDWANKKVVLFSVPGAFTPTCSEQHLPGYIAKLKELKAKGVDVVAVIAYNDAFVMSAWSKANGIKNDEILFLSDDEAKFSKQIGWTAGLRTARYALVVDNGKIVYAGRDEPGKLEASSAEAVLAKL